MNVVTQTIEEYVTALCGLCGAIDINFFEKLYQTEDDEIYYKASTVESRISKMKVERKICITKDTEKNKRIRLSEINGVKELIQIEPNLLKNYELLTGKKGTRFKGTARSKERTYENANLLLYLNNSFFTQIYINGLKVFSVKEPRIKLYQETVKDTQIPIEKIHSNITLVELFSKLDDKTHFFSSKFYASPALVIRETHNNKKRVALPEYRGRQTRGTIIRGTKVYAVYYTDRYDKPWVSDVEFQTMRELEKICVDTWGISDVGALIYVPDEDVAYELLARKYKKGQKYKFLPEKTYDRAFIIPMFVDGAADIGLMVQEILLKEEHELLLAQALLNQKDIVLNREWNATDGINDHYILLDGNIKKMLNLKLRSEKKSILHCFKWQSKYLQERYKGQAIKIKEYTVDQIYNALIEKGVELI